MGRILIYARGEAKKFCLFLRPRRIDRVPRRAVKPRAGISPANPGASIGRERLRQALLETDQGAIPQTDS
jgi:hypothetical protein